MKANARELIARAYRSGVLNSGDVVYMSSVTDPYQPVERRLGLTRTVLEAILDSGVQPWLTIQTRSPLATRDIDLFERFETLRVNVTITTDSEDVRLRYEPHCPSIRARIKAVIALSAAGVRICISISPVLTLKDTATFGSRLADPRADEYVTQYLKSGWSHFATGTSTEALRKVREYREARQRLARILGKERPLLEEVEGYAPA